MSHHNAFGIIEVVSFHRIGHFAALGEFDENILSFGLRNNLAMG